MRLIIIALILSGFSSVSNAQWNSSNTNKNIPSAEPIRPNSNTPTGLPAPTVSTEQKITSVKVYWASQPVQVWPKPARLNNKGIPQEIPPGENFLAIQSQFGPRWIRIHDTDRKNVLNALQEAMQNGTAPYLWLGDKISDISVQDELKKSVLQVEKSKSDAKQIRAQADREFQEYLAQQRKK